MTPIDHLIVLSILATFGVIAGESLWRSRMRRRRHQAPTAAEKPR